MRNDISIFTDEKSNKCRIISVTNNKGVIFCAIIMILISPERFWNISALFLSVGLAGFFTFGLAAPWAFCYRERWVAKHTYIEGHQLHFVGKTIDLWLSLLKWTVFSILTLGLYSFVVPIRFQQWRIKNTYVYGYWDEYYATE